MTTFLLRLDAPGTGPRVAVKDLIDVAGTVTTCANHTLTNRAEVAATDAACVTAVRAGGGRIVGKVNLHELAFGGTGINPFTGTPTNPLDPERIPGGSSSGSAVAVADGEADIALGTDTAGSIRTPSACCGIVGLKTTFGRIPVDGVHPLAPSLDTIGPMAATVAGVEAGMALLEPGFRRADSLPARIGHLRLDGAAPHVQEAVDRALAALGRPVVDVDLPGWNAATDAGSTIAFAEAWAVNRELYEAAADGLTPEVRQRLEQGRSITAGEVDAARAVGRSWRSELDAALAPVEVLALVGIMDTPPEVSTPTLDTRRPNVAVNLGGHPAIVLPLPGPDGFPTSIQLVGRHGAEDLLVTTAAAVEEIAGWHR